ncbi:unnamed protein product, partial [Rotaria sp. Silwood2]
MAFTRATKHQETDTVPSVTDKITDLDLDCDSDTDVSISFDGEMETPVEINSEEIKKDDDRNHAPPISELFVLHDEQSDVEIEPLHIATALIALKSRHHLSQSCIEDILALLSILGINTPSSYKALCTLLRKRSKTHLSPSTHTICPHCENLSHEAYSCTTCGAKYRGRRALIETHKNTEKGVKGPCLLRTLSCFDVGSSFLVDSLHNIYLGLFRRLLSVWLSHQYKDEEWSIYSRTNELSTLLGRIRFPSTTTRHPRPLHKFAKDSVRALHPVETNDQTLNSIFPGKIVYYSTAFIGQVRFTTSHYARNKVSDDSSIIFKTGSKENFGRIRRIFTVNGAEPMFYVDTLPSMTAFK